MFDGQISLVKQLTEAIVAEWVRSAAAERQERNDGMQVSSGTTYLFFRCVNKYYW